MQANIGNPYFKYILILKILLTAVYIIKLPPRNKGIHKNLLEFRNLDYIYQILTNMNVGMIKNKTANTMN